MARYLGLLGAQLRASASAAMQYRIDFFLGGLMSLFWLTWNLVPLFVVFGRRPTVAGWSLDEALLVIAAFSFLKGLYEAAIQPSLIAVVEHIRKGTLDFILLKPADAQFLVSTAKFEPWSGSEALGGVIIGAVALHRLGRVPSLAQAVAAAALLTCAVAVLYAISILVVSAAFWVVRVDNLTFLFSSIFDAARWPATIFRGAWRILFTFVIPLALMTTYPAIALLGTLRRSTALFAVGGAIALVALSRLIWTRAIGHYTSASS